MTTIKVGETITLKIDVSGSNSSPTVEATGDCLALTRTDNTLSIRGVKVGSSTITATVAGISNEFQVTVVPQPVTVSLEVVPPAAPVEPQAPSEEASTQAAVKASAAHADALKALIRGGKTLAQAEAALRRR
jgi:uncharacterized protein YjdB